MTEANFNQDISKPLLCQKNDEIDLFRPTLGQCSCVNRMIYEYNKPHNKIEGFTLTGFPDKWVYNNSGLISVLLFLFCLVPFISFISVILMILFLHDLKKKYTELRHIVKKPWKNMFVLEDSPMTFYFATFTSENFNHLYGKILYGIPPSEIKKLREKIEKELRERPILTVCSQNAKIVYKGLNNMRCAIITAVIFSLLSTGIAIGLYSFIFLARF